MNARLQASIDELERGGGIRCATVEELFSCLNDDDELFDNVEDLFASWDAYIDMSELESLEVVFRRWLRDYEVHTTERWHRLSIGEMKSLCDFQWQEFLEVYAGWRKHGEKEPSVEFHPE